MKKCIFILTVNFFSTALSAQTNTFVPQQMEWGTFLATPSINYYGSIREVLTTPNREVVFAYGTLQNENSVVESERFISTNSYQQSINGGSDIIISKINSNGQCVFGTYFGGSQEELFSGIGVDHQDNLYVSGRTFSYENIATPNGHKTTYTGYIMPALIFQLPDGTLYEGAPEQPITDGFLAKFNSQGNLLWSTYIGGHRGANINKPQISDTGVFISGSTLSIQEFTTANVFQSNWPVSVPTENGIGTVQPTVNFLSKYNFNGDLLWRTYTHNIGAITREDINGNICFVQFRPLIPTENILSDLTKINGVNGQLLNTVALPSVLHGKIIDFNIDNLLNNYFVIETEEDQLGTVGTFRPNKVTQGTYPNKQYVLLKYSANMDLQYATYLPFVNSTNYPQIILRNNNVYIGGVTYEAGLGTENVFQTNKIGFANAYLLKLNTTGALDWFTYIGSESVVGLEIAGDFQNEVYVSVASTDAGNMVSENGVLSDSDLFEPTLQGYRSTITKLTEIKDASTENFLKDKIKVYPNPVKNYLTVDVSDELLGKSLSYIIYDNLGRVIDKGSDFNNQQLKINVEKYASGIYNLQIIDNQSKVFQNFKIVKE